MTHHPELNSVACLMGSGYFAPFAVANPVSLAADGDSLQRMDVSHQLASLARRPLLLWHGDADVRCRRKRPSVLSKRSGERPCSQG